MPVLHRHGTTHSIRWFRHTAPFSRPLRHAGDTEDVYSRLKTPASSRGAKVPIPSENESQETTHRNHHKLGFHHDVCKSKLVRISLLEELKYLLQINVLYLQHLRDFVTFYNFIIIQQQVSFVCCSFSVCSFIVFSKSHLGGCFLCMNHHVCLETCSLLCAISTHLTHIRLLSCV